MKKTRNTGDASKIRPELVRLIHDKVISLCQKKYSSFEVDGLICITLLDTKEQQVIKIHKTLKSVTADTLISTKQTSVKNSAYPNIAAILSSSGNSGRSDSVIDNGNDRIRSKLEEKLSADQTSYQNDISKLSDLLKETNERNSVEKNGTAMTEEQKEKKSKRKNRRPKQVLEKLSDQVNPPEDTAEVNQSDYDKYTDSMIIVKEEPLDDEYNLALNDQTTDSQEQGDRTSDEGVTIEAEVPDDNSEVHSQLNDASGKAVPIPVSTYIGSIIDKTLGVGPIADSQSQEENNEGSFSSYMVQKNDNIKEPEGPNQKHSEWLYNLAQRSRIDIENNSGSDSGSSDSLSKNKTKRYPANRERGRQEPDPHGRSWYEMIKSNASKYQAALMRSGTKDKTSDEISTPANNSSFEQLRELLKDRRHTDKGVLIDGKKGPNAEEDTMNNDETIGDTVSNAMNVDVSDSEKSRSISPTPVIKIEVDEQGPIYYNQNSNEDNEVNNDIPVKTSPQKTPGKLESRYPALFNQLQQSRREVTPSMDQPDSLVNRLPFISFQEIFSQSGQSASNTVTKTSSTMSGNKSSNSDTLDDQLNDNTNKKSKTVWNWKKRAVRPKDKDGNILGYFPAQLPASQSSMSVRPLGIFMSAKKTFAKKRNKPDDDEDDTDWIPSSDKKVKFKASVKETEGSRSRLSTRLSSGDKPRIDFAEMDTSDLDEEDLESDEKNPDYHNEDDIELISAFCRYQCGRRFETFGDLAEHEDVCEAKTVGSNNGGDSGGQTGQDGHKCEICGLDFNQQYRWQYHMVKVHGVSVDTANLFR